MNARLDRFLTPLAGAAFVPIVCLAAATGPEVAPRLPQDRCAFDLAEAFAAKTEAPPPDVLARLRELGRASAAVTTLRAHFEQEKHVTIVRDVLRSSGTFWLDRRGRIAWQVAEPDPVRVVIRTDGVFVAGKRVWAGSAGSGESVPNATLSPLPMLEGLNGIFAGVSEETVRDFEVTFRDRERLRLVPRARSLSSWVSAIEITLGGEAQTPRLVRLEEPAGDVTEIRFSDVTVNPPLDDAAFAP